jgi:hypothetical protein
VWLGDETNSTFWAILFLKLVCFVAACCAHWSKVDNQIVGEQCLVNLFPCKTH